MKTSSHPAARSCATQARDVGLDAVRRRLLRRAACTRSRRRASRRRPCGRSSRTRPRRSRARRSAARAPRRSGRGRGRPGGSTTPTRAGSSGVAPERREAVPVRALRARGRRARPLRRRSAGSAARSRGRSTCRDLQRRYETLEIVVVRPPADGGTDQPSAGKVAHDHARLGEPLDDVGGLVRRRRARRTSVARSSGRRRRGLHRRAATRKRSAISLRARAPRRDRCDRRPQPGDGARRREIRVEPRRAVLRLEASVLLVRLLREVARAAQRGARPGSATTSAPVPSGPQSHFCPETCSSRARVASTGTTPTDCAPSTRIGSPRRSRGARAPEAPHPSSRGRARGRSAACAA